MKRTRLISVCFTALLLLSGCSNPLKQPPVDVFSSQSAADSPFPRFDLAALQTRIEYLKSIWTEPDKEKEIKDLIQELLDAENEAYAINVRAELAYRAKWSDQNLYEANSTTWEDYCVADEMLTWAFANGKKHSAYQDLFTEYVDDSWGDYYIINSLTRVMSSARINSTEHTELMDQYYDTAYDADISTDESNMECAKLYLDVLETYDLSDFLYSSYCRDYTAEQASDVADSVLEKIVPVYQMLYDDIVADPLYNKMAEGKCDKIDAYALLKEYAPRISPAIAESVDVLFSEKLYQIAKGDDCYDGCYTVCLPGEKKALMYTFLADDFYDVISVSHEFGHFHCDLGDETPIYQQYNCIDVAEAQSQGMEMLFTRFYPEIFKEDAAFMEKLAIYNILGSVIAGLAIGQFEYQVMQNAESYSAEDVLNCYDEIREQFDLSTELYEISHLFEQPGYYVSYGISALPAIQIYALMQENQEEAVSIYEKLSGISSFSGEMFFSEAMKTCNLRDPFAADTIDYISDAIRQRLKALS